MQIEWKLCQNRFYYNSKAKQICAAIRHFYFIQCRWKEILSIFDKWEQSHVFHVSIPNIAHKWWDTSQLTGHKYPNHIHGCYCFGCQNYICAIWSFTWCEWMRRILSQGRILSVICVSGGCTIRKRIITVPKWNSFNCSSCYLRLHSIVIYLMNN